MSAGDVEHPRRPGLSVGPWTLTLPVFAAVVVFLVAPLLLLLAYSFLSAGIFTVSGPVTLDNYVSALTSSVISRLAVNSVLTGLFTALVTTLLALPVAYWLRYHAGRLQMVVLFLVVASMFASYLVRIYAWRSILGDHGLLNSGLLQLGLIDEPLQFLLYNRLAVVLALTHIFLPYVVLVLYAAMSPIKPETLHSAQDLGANAFYRWRGVILPLIAAPLMSAFVFVFVLSAGDYVTPQFLGGTSGSMLGVLIQGSFLTEGNWAGGAAISFLMMIAFGLLFLLSQLMLRILRLHDVEFG